jgi:tRNA nucleotidyltransferase (CCA-adding enzyme)
LEIYLVGGAVRDQLLGLPVTERDWVVVGGTPEAMLAQGYQQVGKDFPVFLHPKSKEEYALARKERKTAKGYKGFQFDFDAKVSLEEDLLRRDITINAIAQTRQGTLIDPYGGQRDIQQRKLRHVSPAFVEDPVRLLRVARFAARFADLGFEVAAETLQLLTSMVASKEIEALVAERVWAELHKALITNTPMRFFDVLHACGALSYLFPELTPLANKQHPLRKSLQLAVQQQHAAPLRFAIVLAVTGTDLSALTGFCRRYRVPTHFQDIAQLVAQYYPLYKCASQLTAEALLRLLEKLDVLRRPQRFNDFLAVCDCIAEGQQAEVTLQSGNLKAYADVLKAVPIQSIVKSGLQGKALANAIREARMQALNLQITDKNRR